ncbi:MAG: hypothetical protein R3D26_18975 [Cyanobacteriota/Melainabacteria group bacterium]
MLNSQPLNIHNSGLELSPGEPAFSRFEKISKGLLTVGNHTLASSEPSLVNKTEIIEGIRITGGSRLLEPVNRLVEIRLLYFTTTITTQINIGQVVLGAAMAGPGGKQIPVAGALCVFCDSSAACISKAQGALRLRVARFCFLN